MTIRLTCWLGRRFRCQKVKFPEPVKSVSFVHFKLVRTLIGNMNVGVKSIPLHPFPNRSWTLHGSSPLVNELLLDDLLRNTPRNFGTASLLSEQDVFRNMARVSDQSIPYK
jgi:hypothetical protein